MAEPERLSWRKGKETVVGEGNAGEKLAEIVTWYDPMDDADIDPDKLQIEEGLVAEVMKRLEEEINRPCGDGGGDGSEGAPWFADRQCHLDQMASSSSSSSSATAAGAAFVTVSGNKESCGPSFSDSASTVMASIDTCGVPRQPIRVAAVDEMEEIWPWFLEPAAEAAALGDGVEAAAEGGGGGGAATEGFAVEDTEGSDDEWLARVLSGAGVEAEAQR